MSMIVRLLPVVVMGMCFDLRAETGVAQGGTEEYPWSMSIEQQGTSLDIVFDGRSRQRTIDVGVRPRRGLLVVRVDESLGSKRTEAHVVDRYDRDDEYNKTRGHVRGESEVLLQELEPRRKITVKNILNREDYEKFWTTRGAMMGLGAGGVGLMGLVVAGAVTAAVLWAPFLLAAGFLIGAEVGQALARKRSKEPMWSRERYYDKVLSSKTI